MCYQKKIQKYFLSDPANRKKYVRCKVKGYSKGHPSLHLEN